MKEIDLTEQVMERIHMQNIRMRPRMYFAARFWALNISLSFCMAAFIFLVGLVIFKIRLYYPFGFLKFGFAGLNPFIRLLPWDIVALAFAIFSLGKAVWGKLEILSIKKYNIFVYAVCALMFAGGFLVDQTGINEALKKSGNLPVLYRGRYVSNTWVIGEVVDIDFYSKKMILAVPGIEDQTVAWMDDTLLSTTSGLSKAKYVQVIGLNENGVFKATAVAVIDNYPANFHKL